MKEIDRTKLKKKVGSCYKNSPTVDDVKEMKVLHDGGYTITSIAKAFGVSRVTAGKWIHG